MSRQVQGLDFERYAFEASIHEHPGERTHQLAFCDWLVEAAGYSTIGAKRIVTRVVREAVEEWCRVRVAQWLDSGSLQAARVKRAVQNTVEAEDPEEASVKVVAGGLGPHYQTITIREWDSGDVRLVDWIEVGHRWVMTMCERWNIQITGLNDQGGPYA